MPLLQGHLRFEKFGSLIYRLRPTLHLLALNHTATEILALCDGKTSATIVADQISACHPGVDPQRIRQEVLAFLQASLAEGVVTC
jgi:hypothetical protein